jgi:hypothetical protein
MRCESFLKIVMMDHMTLSPRLVPSARTHTHVLVETCTLLGRTSRRLNRDRSPIAGEINARMTDGRTEKFGKPAQVNKMGGGVGVRAAIARTTMRISGVTWHSPGALPPRDRS